MTANSAGWRRRGHAFLALDFVSYIVDNFSHDDTAHHAAAALAPARRAGRLRST